MHLIENFNNYLFYRRLECYSKYEGLFELKTTESVIFDEIDHWWRYVLTIIVDI